MVRVPRLIQDDPPSVTVAELPVPDEALPPVPTVAFTLKTVPPEAIFNALSLAPPPAPIMRSPLFVHTEPTPITRAVAIEEEQFPKVPMVPAELATIPPLEIMSWANCDWLPTIRSEERRVG